MRGEGSMLAAVFDLSWLFWLFILAQFFIPLYQKRLLAVRRDRAFQLRLAEREVPPGCYYVVGDRMELSEDSRFFGPIASEAVWGKMLFAPPVLPSTRHIAFKFDQGGRS